MRFVGEREEEDVLEVEDIWGAGLLLILGWWCVLFVVQFAASGESLGSWGKS